MMKEYSDKISFVLKQAALYIEALCVSWGLCKNMS